MDNKIESHQIDADWFAFTFKSGEILFYYNKKTGEHRWKNDGLSFHVVKDIVKEGLDQNIDTVTSIATQSANPHKSIKNPSKTFSTTGVETEINGVDSNNELASLFTLADKVCQKKREVSGEVIHCDTGVDPCETQDQIKNKVTSLVDMVPSNQGDLSGELNQSKHIESCEENGQRSITVDVSLPTIPSTVPENISTETDVKPQQSKQCNKSFTSQRKQKIHIEPIPSDVKQAKPKTMESFPHSTSQTQSKNTLVKKYECTNCEKKFLHARSLRRHELIHSSTKLYECKCCSKTFILEMRLKSHERIHTGNRPYPCNICGKAFIDFRNLKVHTRIHTGVRPYKCTNCTKAFAIKSDLTIHERIHTGVKPFKCKYCSRAFTTGSNQKKHEKIHSGLKPHRCEYCNKTFRLNSYLKMHVLLHSDVKPHRCEYCNRAFRLKCYLKKHERVHTGA